MWLKQSTEPLQKLPEEEGREKGIENVFETLMSENSLSYVRHQTTDPENWEPTKWDKCKTK